MQTNLFYVCSKPTLVHTSQILNSCFPVKKTKNRTITEAIVLWDFGS